VTASLVGREQEIEIGPLSGHANVAYWLEYRGLTGDELLVERILAAAKAARKKLSHADIYRMLAEPS
jgi:2-isopropylmalate synthase